MSMEASKITKRLHISGLTPSITKEDLQKRLSSYGTVKALDGFGHLDGLGQPRKFGYITIETTAPQIAKCVNLLSGTTWKGAKLRLGDAKPDFKERLAREREEEERPSKRQRRSMGVHAEDMSLVTPENVSERHGWKITASGRIVRPMRMKPTKPLTALPKPNSGVEGKKHDKRTSRIKPPPSRARPRTLDPTAWGSVHLKGDLLNVIGNGQRISDATDVIVPVSDSESDESEDSSVDEDPPAPTTTTVPPHAAPTSPNPIALTSLPFDSSQRPDAQDLQREKAAALRLLQSHFSGMDDADWIGKESVGSDIEEAELPPVPTANLEDATFEEIPMDVDQVVPPSSPPPNKGDPQTIKSVPTPLAHAPPPKDVKPHTTALKNLFAPQEEDTAFSLLGNLGIDLELDDDLPFQTDIHSQSAPLHSQPSIPDETAPIVLVSSATRKPAALDPKKPLFFPLQSSFRYKQEVDTAPLAKTTLKSRAMDLFDLAREKGYNWRDPSVTPGFWRTETDEQIKKRWEDQKVQLTRDWKRRWRDAVKLRRRRGAGDNAE